MNVYDFDGTIYAGDSTVDFFLYALRKNPSLIRFLPHQFGGFIRYLCKKIDKTQLKECFFCFLKGFDAQTALDDFWKMHEKKIYPWYHEQKTEQDVIISASPYFLLEPVCRSLSVGKLIATEVDVKTGKTFGKNCRGEEKVQRFRKEYPAEKIERFYSDSKSDLPLAHLAEHAYFVKNGVPHKWQKEDQN